MLKKIVNIIFCKIIYRVKYYNIENLYNNNQCLICPNHSNIFDPVFIYTQQDNLYSMAKAEIFRNKLISKFLKHYGVFPVDRKKTDYKSLLHSINIFKQNKNAKLIIFPEGKIIKDNKEIRKVVKNGAVFIAAYSNIPILPVYITRRPKIFSTVNVIFGKPMLINKNILKSKDDIKKKSKELINIIYDLKDKK